MVAQIVFILLDDICSICTKKIYIFSCAFRDKKTNKYSHFDCFEDKLFKNEVLKIKFMLLLEKWNTRIMLIPSLPFLRWMAFFYLKDNNYALM